MGNSAGLMKILKNNNAPVILWGAGHYYHTTRDYIKHFIAVDYIYDKKWENSNITEFDGYSVLSFEEIKHIGQCLILTCFLDRSIEKEVCDKISANIPDAQVYVLRDVFPIGRILEREEIITEAGDKVYQDFYGNSIEYTTLTSLDKVNIRFYGLNAKIKIGKDVRTANALYIECGNNAEVYIGDATTFDKTTLYASYGAVEIGSDCMFSYDVFIRNHDSHFIFDARTGNRINYSRKIKIDDHVWIGQNSILLSGFSIGEDSIIGAGSISSSSFPDKVVIAGNPARVVREGVTWHRSMTWTADYHNIDEIT